MNIFLDNVNLTSNSGPNHFGRKLKKYLEKRKCTFTFGMPIDLQLTFIEAQNRIEAPLVQRLDGIYFNNKFDFNMQNSNILRTYEQAKGVIFQTKFNKLLTHKYFGPHENSVTITNGADMELIETIIPANDIEYPFLSFYDNVWCCASSWRPHKRLHENINYFLENKGPNDCLLVAGQTPKIIKDPSVYYLGNLTVKQLLSVYKRSDVFIHLAWLDHCPNVVVDARACGCKIICSSSGGTKEVAGPGAKLVMDQHWDYSPVDLYNPPPMNYAKTVINEVDSNIDMEHVAGKYKTFLEKIINANY